MTHDWTCVISKTKKAIAVGAPIGLRSTRISAQVDQHCKDIILYNGHESQALIALSIYL